MSELGQAPFKWAWEPEHQARAYAISSLTGVEVVNERFGDDFVAVTY